MVIVLHCGEDGDKSLRIYKDDQEFITWLKKAYDSDKPGYGPKFITPDENGDIDLETVDGMIVIRGAIVEPQAKKVAIEWTM